MVMSPLMGGETTSVPGIRPRPLERRYWGSAAMRTIVVFSAASSGLMAGSASSW